MCGPIDEAEVDCCTFWKGSSAVLAEVDQPSILGDLGLSVYFTSLIWHHIHHSFSLAMQSSLTSPQAELSSPQQGTSYDVLMWITL